jgi:tRNA threonylcarbamoyladenosine biosynthesis protein TsaB
MIVLGIDTSGYNNAVGVVDGDKVLSDCTYEAKTDSLQQIVANIDSALKGAGMTLENVGGIGVGLGPGSWTGIRVGVTVGKMLAFSAGKPVCGVPTLEALAYQARNESGLVCAVISVGTGGAVYAAGYRSENDLVSRIGEYYVGDVKGLTGLITGPAVLVGKEAQEYTRIVEKESGVKIRAVEAVPGGAAVACLAARRFGMGEHDDVLSLTPLYLKESTAKAFINKYRSTRK